jgi:hypothetical protein
MVSTVGDVGYEGFRVDRNTSTSNTMPKTPEGPEGLSEIESLPKINIPKDISGAIPVRIKKVEAKPSPTLTPLTPMTPGPYIPIEVSSNAETEQIVEKEVVPVSVEDSVSEVENKVTSPEVVESESKDHIPYGVGFVDLVNLENGGRAVKFNGIEIAHEYDDMFGKAFYLDDQFQNGPMFSNVRGAFSVFLAEKIGEDAKLLPTVDFEGGRIDIIKNDTPEGAFHVLLNGRTVATGSISGKKVEIATLKNLKGHWYEADTVYERAKNVAERVIKNSTKK